MRRASGPVLMSRADNTGENARREHMSWGAEFPRSTVPQVIYVERSHWLFTLRRHFGARSERHTWPTTAEHSFGSCSGRRQGSYKKLNLKFKNIQEHFWGENKFVQEHFRRVIRTFYLQYYQQSHFVP